MTSTSDDKINNPVSLSDITRSINNVNLENEIVVFDSEFVPMSAAHFPTRIDALIIILCREGSGKIVVDLREYEVLPGSIVVLQPKNYVNLLSFDPSFKAHMIACSRRVIEEVIPKLTDLLPLLIHHRTTPVSYLQPEKADELNQYYEFIKIQLSKPHTIFIKNKVQCLLQAALFELMDIQTSASENISFQKSRKEEIMAKFIIKVSENFRTERKVSFYAKALCITPKHLSSVVKRISGRTAGEWIENYVTMEAKVLLKTTDKTIQEIASILNFPNQSFFGKYFRHITGLSPSEYRRSIAE